MARTKLVSESEAVAWLADGKTYAWCVEQYKVKYNLQVTGGMFAKLRQRSGLERRIVRDEELIPWAVKTHHRWAYPVVMLRFEAKRRAGKELSDLELSKLEPFLAKLKDLDLVVLYDAETPEGFFLVPREPGDRDIVRQPSKGERSQRRARD